MVVDGGNPIESPFICRHAQSAEAAAAAAAQKAAEEAAKKQASIDKLAEMGFPRGACEAALVRANWNEERALEFLFG